MSTPFSRPGAIDLSALAGPPPSATGGRAAPGAGARFAVQIDEQNLQGLLESSMTAPVVLVVYSPSQSAASASLAEDLTTLADELDGRIAVGRLDADAQPGIASALQIPTVPLVAMVLQGRLQPLLQDAPPLAELRTLFGQLLQQLAAQGFSGRHAPLGSGAPAAEEGAEDAGDPRHAPAEEALMAGDLDRAVSEYQRLVSADPSDTEAAVGLARAQLMQRTATVDAAAARARAAAAPDDVEAQLLVADLDLLGGHVADAFDRLLDLVRRSAGEERDRARTHLLELFAVVGNEDPRVLRGRRDLASALF